MSETNGQDVSKGVLDSEYAAERVKKPELIFRYKSRALVVSRAVKKFAPDLTRPDLVAFGCADGLTLLELDRLLSCRIGIGVEYAAELLARAPKMPEHLRLLQGDVTSLPPELTDESVDLVSALALIEHLPDPLAAAKEAWRILKPGGLFVFTCPSPIWDDISTKVKLLHEEQHESDMNRAAMTKLARDAGFQVMEYLPFMNAPIGFLPYLKIPVPPSLALGIDKLIHLPRIFDFCFVNQCLIARK